MNAYISYVFPSFRSTVNRSRWRRFSCRPPTFGKLSLSDANSTSQQSLTKCQRWVRVVRGFSRLTHDCHCINEWEKHYILLKKCRPMIESLHALAEFGQKSGRLQTEILNQQMGLKARFLKITLAEGYDDFASVHRIFVVGEE